jgi:hypothetical protein
MLIVLRTAETVASVGPAAPDVTFALTVFAGMVFASIALVMPPFGTLMVPLGVPASIGPPVSPAPVAMLVMTAGG